MRFTFSFLSERQSRGHGYLAFLSGTHVQHPDVQAFNDLSHTDDKPLRVSRFVRATGNTAKSQEAQTPEVLFIHSDIYKSLQSLI